MEKMEKKISKKTAMKVIGINSYPSLQSTLEDSVIKKTNHILNDLSVYLFFFLP